jgi:hypothetical protein
MRSNQIFGAAAVALCLGVSLGFSGALAATPTLNFRNTADLKNLMPARTGVSSLALMANKDATTPQGLAARVAVGSNMNLAARAGNLRASALARRHGLGLNVMRAGAPKESKGLAALKVGAGLPDATSPAMRQLALAAAKPRSSDSLKLLSGVGTH